MWLKVLMYIILGFFVFLMIFSVLTYPYVNPYKLIMIFGKKGSGKSTILAKLARQYNKKGWTVYSTEYIPDTYYIDPKDIGYYELPDVKYKPVNIDNYRGLRKLLLKLRLHFFPDRPKTLLLIDEVGMIYDNRNFKNFSNQVRDFFKLQRHYHVKCYMFSQTFDVDKKLRDLTDCMYLVRNVARVFCYGKRIKKYITIKDSMSDDSSNLAEGLEFEPFIFFWLGTRTLTYIPKYAKGFNSFVAPELPKMEFRLTTYDRDKLPSSSDDDPECVDEKLTG